MTSFSYIQVLAVVKTAGRSRGMHVLNVVWYFLDNVVTTVFVTAVKKTIVIQIMPLRLTTTVVEVPLF